MKLIFVLYKIVIWSVISLLGIIAMGKFVSLLIEDVSAGKDIFIPGVSVLMLGVLTVLIFAVTRVVKYIKILRNKNENS